MSWVLRGFGSLPLNVSSARVTYTENSIGFRKGFKWARKAHGDCMQMVFHANPSVVDLQVREVVSLEVDGTPQFMGTIIKHPGHQSKGAGPSDPDSMDEYIVYGLSSLMKETLMNGNSTSEAGSLPNNVSELVRYLVLNVVNDRARYSSTEIPLIGGELSAFHMPHYPMNQVFDLLMQSLPGVTWGVNAEGFFYFKTSSTQYSLNYVNDDLYVDWIPINAEEVTTAVTLIAVAEPSESLLGLPSLQGPLIRRSDTPFGGLQTVPYMPNPEVIKYEDPIYHAIYGARISRLMGGLLKADAALLAFITPFTSNFANGLNAYDDDMNTYASTSANNASTGTIQYLFNQNAGAGEYARRTVGCRLAYSSIHANNEIRLQLFWADTVGGGSAGSTAIQEITFYIPPSGAVLGEKRIIDIIFPRDVALEGKVNSLSITLQSTNNNPGAVYIYELVPIYLDAELGTEIGKSLVKLPAQNPATITVANQLLQPRKSLYITDVPSIASGILQGNAEEYEYTVSPQEGRMTQIKFEQPDVSDEALIAKHMAQQLDSQTVGQIRSVKL